MKLRLLLPARLLHIFNVSAKNLRFINKPTLFLLAITLALLSCKENKKSPLKDLPINVTINNDYTENIIQKNEVKINIPIGWRVYSEEEKQIALSEFNSNSQYKLTFDYFLRLNTDETYPSSSISINQSSEFDKLNFNDFSKLFLKSYSNNVPTILDGVKSAITNQSSIGNYIDEKNKTLYIIDEAQVSNQGTIKTISAIILKKDYIICIVLNTRPESFEKYRATFSIMVNSVRI
jgi:hypothetical protein